jgi:hypothetical protein
MAGIKPVVADPFGPGIGGLETWHDATDISTLFTDAAMTTAVTTTGDPLGAWGDKSGNGHHQTQATAGLRPAYDTTTMAQNSISFTGEAGGREFLYNATDKPTVMLFAVVQTSIWNGRALFGFDSNNNKYVHMDNGGNIYVSAPDLGYSTVAGNYSGFDPLNEPHILTVDIKNYLNLDFTQYPINVPSDTGGAPSGTYIGRRHNTPNNEAPFTGNIVELLTYNRKLTATEVADVEDFLNSKHSLGLTR